MLMHTKMLQSQGMYQLIVEPSKKAHQHEWRKNGSDNKFFIWSIWQEITG